MMIAISFVCECFKNKVVNKMSSVFKYYFQVFFLYSLKFKKASSTIFKIFALAKKKQSDLMFFCEVLKLLSSFTIFFKFHDIDNSTTFGKF